MITAFFSQNISEVQIHPHVPGFLIPKIPGNIRVKLYSSELIKYRLKQTKIDSNLFKNTNINNHFLEFTSAESNTGGLSLYIDDRLSYISRQDLFLFFSVWVFFHEHS